MYVQLKNKYYDWSIRKNKWLIKNRNISFEEIKSAIEENRVLIDMKHPTLIKQRLLIFNKNNYAYVAPYVEDTQKIFFKTIYPSRKYTKKYLP
ncbi:DUF4258 domain-containing protein [Patescibacteria group bacterium]|nr:DUF4258 domain-containing protein [Patescibacteria group bacterium]MBU1967505.1 DUF4258 domain-containing protein [Patescibacteria group bacterium]MBU2543115.1 DUF4258 domain-containing protein [Patescibacteria group bacterium]